MTKDKKCPICGRVYASNLPACPHCKESNIGYCTNSKIDHSSSALSSQHIASFERNLYEYNKQRKHIQWLAIIALCCALILVAFTLLN